MRVYYKFLLTGISPTTRLDVHLQDMSNNMLKPDLRLALMRDNMLQL
jgi:hypothetical protein